MNFLEDWVGMAHRYCIDNPLLVYVFFTFCSAIIAIYYYKFVSVNDKIRNIKRLQGQQEVDDTFKWFAITFYACAIRTAFSIVTLYYGLYIIEALAIAFNAIVIVKTYYVYEGQQQLFSARSITEKDVQEREQVVINDLESMLSNAKKLKLSDKAMRDIVEGLKNKYGN